MEDAIGQDFALDPELKAPTSNPHPHKEPEQLSTARTSHHQEEAQQSPI